MKTLDKVITELEDEGLFADALHYLKVFRAEREHLVELHRELVKENDNNPLTWSELRQMEGKPVWMKRPEWKEWLLVSEIDEDKCEIYLRDKWGNGIIVNGRNVGYWRAYRKERQ